MIPTNPAPVAADSISLYEFAPMTVLVMSLGFIAVVCVLHVAAKVSSPPPAGTLGLSAAPLRQRCRGHVGGQGLGGRTQHLTQAPLAVLRADPLCLRFRGRRPRAPPGTGRFVLGGAHHLGRVATLVPRRCGSDPGVKEANAAWRVQVARCTMVHLMLAFIARLAPCSGQPRA